MKEGKANGKAGERRQREKGRKGWGGRSKDLIWTVQLNDNLKIHLYYMAIDLPSRRSVAAAKTTADIANHCDVTLGV